MKSIAATCILILACCAPHSAFSRGQRSRGKTDFNTVGCAHCHGIRGIGGQKGPDLSGIGRRMKKDRLRQQIEEGSKRMPPFADDLQENELNDLIAYLRSCRDRKR
jgi:mono/diheme cytochrome c family protein